MAENEVTKMIETILALVLFLFPLAYSPGPGNMFFAANGARFGFRSTVSASLGYHVATWVVTACIGLGFVATLEAAPQAFLALKIAGSLYVFWLAWRLFHAGVAENGLDAKPASFLDGVILLLLNPKAYVIIALMFTQFLHSSDDKQTALILMIATVFTLNNLVAFSVWTVIGDRLAACFARAESARALNMLFGLILAAVAVWMFIS